MRDEYVNVWGQNGKSIGMTNEWQRVPDVADFIIFKRGAKTYAKDGNTGEIVYKDVDAATVIQWVINNLGEGGKIFIKKGLYVINKKITIDRRVTIEGEGHGAPTSWDKAMTILKLADNFPDDTMFDLVPSSGLTDTWWQLPVFTRMMLNGNRNNQTKEINCFTQETGSAVDIHFLRLWFNDWSGYAIYLQDYYDHHIEDCVFEGTDHYSIYIGNATANYITHNYMTSGGGFVFFDTANPTLIASNHISSTSTTDALFYYNLSIAGGYAQRYIGNYLRGHKIIDSTGASSIQLYIIGNEIMGQSTSDNPLINLYHVSYAKILSNHFSYADVAIQLNSNTAIPMIAYNTFDTGNVTTPISGSASSSYPTYIHHNYGWQTENSGTYTASGDGSTTQFTIAHGLVAEPSKVTVTPASADAAGDFYVTKDATNIYINYKTAPASGTDNLSWYWEAGV